MQAMQSLVRLPEVANTMREMSKEMMKAGIIEEMMDETMESLEDTDEMEEEAQSEVDKVTYTYPISFYNLVFIIDLFNPFPLQVLWELTQGKLGEAPAPPITSEGTPVATTSHENEKEEEDLDEMQSRLEALRS